MLKRRLNNTKKDKLDTPKSHRVVNLKTKVVRKKAEIAKNKSWKKRQSSGMKATAQHSKLTDKERKKILKRIMTMEAKRKMDNGEIGNETEVVERNKCLIMWSGVTFFMVLITVFWLYNAKQVFQRSDRENHGDFSLDGWHELTDEIGGRINEMAVEWEELHSLASTSADNVLGLPKSGLNATGTDSGLGQEEIEELKKRLEDGR